MPHFKGFAIPLWVLPWWISNQMHMSKFGSEMPADLILKV